MSNAALAASFFAALLATVAALAGAVWQARQRKPRAHVAGIAVSAVLLVVTILLAEAMGKRYDFVAWVYRIHMSAAYTTTAVLVLALGSGALHWTGKLSRKAHFFVAAAWGATLVAALGTGLWMFAGAVPKAAPATPAAADTR